MKSREPVKAIGRGIGAFRIEEALFEPEERAEKERAPPLTSHNRPGKRFAATLDSAPHKPNQINDKDLHARDALPGASERNLWQGDLCACHDVTIQLCNRRAFVCGVCVVTHTPVR
jgi:hypothetical protein